MKRLIFVLVLAAAVPLMSVQTTALTVVGFSDTSCGMWTEARAIHRAGEMETWALGFVSGVNFARYVEDDKIDILKGTGDVAGIWSWLDNYCRSQPLEKFPSAVAHLAGELLVRPH